MNKAQLGPHLKFTTVLESKHETSVRHPRRAVLVSISYARSEYEFPSINVYLTQQSSPRPHTERVKEDRLSVSIKTYSVVRRTLFIHQENLEKEGYASTMLQQNVFHPKLILAELRSGTAGPTSSPDAD